MAPSSHPQTPLPVGNRAIQHVHTKHPHTTYPRCRRVTPATIVVLPLSHFVYSAVTVRVSPESPKRLTSGELRIGPRRHELECDDGTLRQQFPDVVYVFCTSLPHI